MVAPQKMMPGCAECTPLWRSRVGGTRMPGWAAPVQGDGAVVKALGCVLLPWCSSMVCSPQHAESPGKMRPRRAAFCVHRTRRHVSMRICRKQARLHGQRGRETARHRRPLAAMPTARHRPATRSSTARGPSPLAHGLQREKTRVSGRETMVARLEATHHPGSVPHHPSATPGGGPSMTTRATGQRRAEGRYEAHGQAGMTLCTCPEKKREKQGSTRTFQIERHEKIMYPF
jgi:hypothetical protein